jgi:dienelactone hydrolase
MELRRNWARTCVVSCALTVVACGSDTATGSGPVSTGSGASTAVPSGGTGATGAAGKAGSAPATGGAGGVAVVPRAGSGPIGVAGISGAAGKVAAGAGGTAGIVAAGSGGNSGSGGGSTAGAGGGTGSSTGGFIREDDPTDASSKANGKYKVMMYTSGFSGAGQGFGGGTMYYPTDADAPFASVAVVPGFSALQNTIADWGPFLASHGIVVMTIDTLTTLDSPDQRADELMAALKSIAGENTRMGSPLMGKLDTSKQCVSGWSMGGGGTLIAAAKNPTLKCGVSFAAWQPTGGAMNMVPVLMFEGTVDPLAAGMSEPFYMQTPDSVSKMLFEVTGAGHDVANSPSNSMGIIGQYGLSWFKVFLEGDTRYMQFLEQPKPSITNTFETNVK